MSMDPFIQGLALYRSSLVFPERPDRLIRSAVAVSLWTPHLAAGVASSAARYPDSVAIVDDQGELTYADLWHGAASVAAAFRQASLEAGARIGILMTNHRGFVFALLGASLAGADSVLLNTGFAAPQLNDVCRSERLDAIVHDAEFAATVADVEVGHTFDEEWVTRAVAVRVGYPRRPRKPGAVVILTSGTTGAPKGASRHSKGAVRGLASLLSRIPLRARSTVVNVAPLFHAWGLTNLLLSLSSSSTVVLERRFDARDTLDLVARHHANVLVVVPIMMRRILGLDPSDLVTFNTQSLRVIAMSGSAPGAKLVRDVRNRFGPILYNVYGSTEVATATIAGPRDLDQSPSTAGRVVPGVRVAVLDPDGNELPSGIVGRIFVESPIRFEGYTSGETKSAVGSLLASGDLGHFDDKGRLFIDGRDDEMIVSGGENVYPGEVQELISHLDEVEDVVVLGVEDAEFDQTLTAIVVKRSGSEMTTDDVRGYVRDRLARHKIPKRVVFVTQIPRTMSGKVDRRRVREL
jgi:fatty-acyl-CoA synthase